MRLNFLRILGVVVIATSMSNSVSAQKQMFNVGDKDLSVGVGFGSAWVSGSNSMIVPPLSATFDYGLRDDWGPGVFGVGGYISTSLYGSKTTVVGGDEYVYRESTFIIGARATYHYTFVENLDTYGGAILGVRFTREKTIVDTQTGKTTTIDPDAVPVPAPFVGVKYYFTDNFAAYSELGINIAYFTIGATFKF